MGSVMYGKANTFESDRVARGTGRCKPEKYHRYQTSVWRLSELLSSLQAMTNAAERVPCAVLALLVVTQASDNNPVAIAPVVSEQALRDARSGIELLDRRLD